MCPQPPITEIAKWLLISAMFRPLHSITNEEHYEKDLIYREAITWCCCEPTPCAVVKDKWDTKDKLSMKHAIVRTAEIEQRKVKLVALPTIKLHLASGSQSGSQSIRESVSQLGSQSVSQ